MPKRKRSTSKKIGKAIGKGLAGLILAPFKFLGKPAPSNEWNVVVTGKKPVYRRRRKLW